MWPYYPQDTEAHGGYIICLKSHGKELTKSGFECRSLDPQTSALYSTNTQRPKQKAASSDPSLMDCGVQTFTNSASKTDVWCGAGTRGFL